MRDSDHAGYIVLEDVLVKHVTDAAALIEVDGEDHWVPLSLILDESVESDVRNAQDVEVKEWFCRREEII